MCAYQNYHFVSSFFNKKCSGQSSCNASETGWTLRVNLWRNCWKSRGIGGLMELFRFDTQVQPWHRSSENKTSWDSLLGLAHLCSIKTLIYVASKHLCIRRKNEMVDIVQNWYTASPHRRKTTLILCRGSNLLVFGSWQLGELRFAEFFNNLSRQVASKSWRVNGGAKPIDFVAARCDPANPFLDQCPFPGFESDKSFVRCAKVCKRCILGLSDESIFQCLLLALRMETSYKNMRSLCFLVLQCHVVLLT